MQPVGGLGYFLAKVLYRALMLSRTPWAVFVFEHNVGLETKEQGEKNTECQYWLLKLRAFWFFYFGDELCLAESMKFL